MNLKTMHVVFLLLMCCAGASAYVASVATDEVTITDADADSKGNYDLCEVFYEWTGDSGYDYRARVWITPSGSTRDLLDTTTKKKGNGSGYFVSTSETHVNANHKRATGCNPTYTYEVVLQKWDYDPYLTEYRWHDVDTDTSVVGVDPW